MVKTERFRNILKGHRCNLSGHKKLLPHNHVFYRKNLCFRKAVLKHILIVIINFFTHYLYVFTSLIVNENNLDRGPLLMLQCANTHYSCLFRLFILAIFHLRLHRLVSFYEGSGVKKRSRLYPEPDPKQIRSKLVC